MSLRQLTRPPAVSSDPSSARANFGTIPYSIRVCNLSGGVPIEVDLSASRKSRVEMNQCLEVDKPQWAFFRTPTTVSVVELGSYAIFQPGTFKPQPKVGRATPVGSDKQVEIGLFRVAASACQKPYVDRAGRLSRYVWCQRLIRPCDRQYVERAGGQRSQLPFCGNSITEIAPRLPLIGADLRAAALRGSMATFVGAFVDSAQGPRAYV
jgi:hypothetical protein